MKVEKFESRQGRVKAFRCQVNVYKFLFDSAEECSQFGDSLPKYVNGFYEGRVPAMSVVDGQELYFGQPISDYDKKWKIVVHNFVDWVSPFVDKSIDESVLKLYGVKGEFQKELKVSKWLEQFEIVEREGKE